MFIVGIVVYVATMFVVVVVVIVDVRDRSARGSLCRSRSRGSTPFISMQGRRTLVLRYRAMSLRPGLSY